MASQLPVKWSAFGQKLPKYKPAVSGFESDMYQLNIQHVLKKAYVNDQLRQLLVL